VSRPLELPTEQYDRTDPRHPLETLQEPRLEVLSGDETETAAEIETPPPEAPRRSTPLDEDPLDELYRLAANRVGSVLSRRYELRALLGSGAAGAVYEAWDRHYRREVAVKLLHKRLLTSDEHVSRFKAEARAAATIGHPNIATVLDVGRDVKLGLYMTMELLRGQALFFAIAEDTLTDGDVVEVGLQLSSALAAAHRRGIVHRDVKPENVFLTRDPSGKVHVKLLDFGIAKHLQPELARSISTMDGLLIGTPHYMSPEMCTGAPVDEMADLWAAAAVLFHAFAGKPPFDDTHVGRLLMRIVSGRAPSLAKARPDLPAHVVDAIDRGLDRDRDRRWPTAQDLARALRG
jgi:serine/threonine-protein kinase